MLDGWNYAAICGFLWFAFFQTERLLKPDALAALSCWLQGFRVPRRVYQWPDVVIIVFDSVFRVKARAANLPLPGLWRSIIASILTVTVLALIWHRSISEVFDGIPEDHPILKQDFVNWAEVTFNAIFGIWVGVGITINLLVDYLSLLESRIVLRLAIRRYNIYRYAACLVGDAILTGLIAFLGFLVIHPVASRAVYAITLAPDGSHAALEISALDVRIAEFMSMFAHPFYLTIPRIFVYSTFLTSIWIWIFIGVGLIVRTAYGVEGMHRMLVRTFNIEKRPLSTTGWVTIVLFSVVFWGWAYLAHELQ